MSKTRLFVSGMIALAMLPSIASASIDSDLKYGAKGNVVRELQTFLITYKFLTGDATGNFYSLTLAAVKKFQTSEGLPSTGFVGPMTRAAINKKLASTLGAPPGATQDPAMAGLQSQVEQLLKQINALKMPGLATSSLPQKFATTLDAAPFDFDNKWRDAVVNIYCVDRYSGSISSGSGVIIDPRGVILTNAHVATEMLFADWPNPSLTECSIRIGSPAYPQYKAVLLYLPDEFMTTLVNAQFKYNIDELIVTGKKDYALMAITGPVSDAVTMPTTFPYLSIYKGAIAPVNTPVYLSGYAAEFTSYEAVLRNLYQLSSSALVAAQQPIGSSTVPQALGFSGNIGSQHGSSGGPVIGKGGMVLGIISYLNKDYGEKTSERALSAISTEYILSDFQTDTKQSLDAYIATSDFVALSKKFMAENGSRYQQMFAKLWKEKDFAVPGVQ